MFEEYNLHMSSPDPDRDSTILVREAVSCLPDDKKAVVALLVAGFRQHEVSKILQVSRTTVWAKKTSALILLRQFMEGEITCREMDNTDV